MTPNQELQQMLMEQARALREAGDNPLKIEKEVMRANALKGISDSIIKSASVEVQYLRQTGGKQMPFYTEAIAPMLPVKNTEQQLEQPFTPHTEVKEPRKKLSEHRKHQAANADAELLASPPAMIGADTTGKKLIKIDSKTSIYIDADADEQEEIKKYHQLHPKVY